MVPTIFETCRPRTDVLEGTITEADFAADLAQVITGEGNAEYLDPARFFANTYPTRGLKNLLENVCQRLSGAGGEVASIFRLDTSYGGGKTHGLIALCHAARGMEGVADIAEFVDPCILPQSHVRIAAFDGENADPANGRRMKEGLFAYTPWGEIAYALAGEDGYARVRKSDESRVAPGAETLRELFGQEPVLILLDELSVYLRKVRNIEDARFQLTAFLSSLFKAVESVSNAVLVYTLAIGKDGRATDAFNEENQFIADNMAEAESVSARKATLLNPTEEDETVQVLRRRLFEFIDETRVSAIVDAYRNCWIGNRESLGDHAVRPETAEAFRSSYPLHPDVLATLTGKTATLGNFQRVRGMLRLLARTISHLWKEKPKDATAIHLHHINPGYQPIHQEIVTRLGQSAYIPAINNDIAAGPVEKKALAEDIDARDHTGMPPYTVYVARTVFLHTLAFNDPLKGVSREQLRYSVVGPALDISFIEQARKKFISESAYLDDRPGAPMRFLAEANLRQIIRREELHVDAGEARVELNDTIRHIFNDKTFETLLFPGGPFDVPDEVGDGRPKLAVLAYDGLTIGRSVDDVPELIERIYARKGSEGSALRALRNNLVFVVADDARKEEMRRKAFYRLALGKLKKPERLSDLAEHQQAQVKKMEAGSELELAVSIQQCYRHVFYPSRNRIGAGDVDLAHTAIDIHSTSDRPGAGQQQIVRALRDLNKLRLSEDQPDSPAYVRDRTPLKKGQLTTLALREEFRRDPALPILIDDDIFIRGMRRGIEQGEYVYRRGELLYGPGDPAANIKIDEQAVVFTMAYAANAGIWPRTSAGRTKNETGGRQSTTPTRTIVGSGASPISGPTGTYSAGREPEEFNAEGILKEALVQLWEQARAKDVEAIGELSIQLFEASDAFRVFSAIGAVSGAEKIVKLTGGYETTEGGSFELEFRGSVSDAQPVKEFLDPQLRAASTQTIETAFRLTFAKGLSMQGDAAEKITERLARFASGAAYVSAVAKVEV